MSGTKKRKTGAKQPKPSLTPNPLERLNNLENAVAVQAKYIGQMQTTLMTLIPVYTLLKEKGVVTVEELEAEVVRLQSQTNEEDNETDGNGNIEATDSGEVQPKD